MPRRNLLRSWMAASVLALTAATPLLGAPAPAAAADNVTITVYVRDDGFSQTTVDARDGDILVFQLDSAAMRPHMLAWEQGERSFTFDRGSPDGDHVQYGPLNLGKWNSMVLHFYDARYVSGYAAGGPHTGVLNVTKASPPSSTSTSTSTTVTTAPPPTGTTATTMPPTTTTTEPTPVQPFLVPDPAPTTTTAAPANAGAAPVKNGGSTSTTANKDKGKGKAAAAGTTTLAPAPPAAPPDSIFDAESLTPSPATLPDASVVIDPADEAALNAASVLDLLDPEKAVDEDNNDARLLLFGAIAALGMLVVIGGFWWWGHRATRWDPA